MSELYEVIDPRPVAIEAPYTYFLPSTSHLGAIGKDDLVKATFRAIPPSDEWDAERMWVKVTSADFDWLEGTLESTPSDMPNLAKGATIRLPRSHVIDIIFDRSEVEAALPKDTGRGYWDRCLVDQCVLDGDLPVHYLYREAPDMGKPEDKYLDSGWRIRGDMRGCSDEQLAVRKSAYVALGAVLNRDDSWLHLIDQPIGVTFQRDFDTGLFEKVVD